MTMRYGSIGSASTLGRLKLWAVEYFMATDAPPADMFLTWPLLWTIIESGSPILSFPSHLEEIRVILHGLDTEAAAKRTASEIDDELLHRETKRSLLRVG